MIGFELPWALRFRPIIRSGVSNITGGSGSAAGDSTAIAGGTVGVEYTATYTYTPHSNSTAIAARRQPGAHISQTLGQPVELTFDIGVAYTPIVGHEVIFDVGPGPLVEGIIISVSKTFQDKLVNPVWKVHVAGYEYLFNKKRPMGSWVQTSAATIAFFLVNCYAPAFSTAGVQVGLPPIDLTLDGSQTLSEVFSNIALQVGGTFRLQNTEVQLFQSMLVYTPNTVAQNNIILHPEPIYTQDISQVRTRDYVRSTTLTSVATDIPAGATIIPVEDVTKLPYSGDIFVNGQLLRYGGVNVVTVVENTTDFPPPKKQGEAGNASTSNGVAYPAGNYDIFLSFKYPNGHESSATKITTVHLDGTSAIQLQNLPIPPAGVAQNVYVQQSSDAGTPNTTGAIVTLDPAVSGATIIFSPVNGRTGTFRLEFPAQGGGSIDAPGGVITQQSFTFSALPTFILDGVIVPQGTQNIPIGFLVTNAWLSPIFYLEDASADILTTPPWPILTREFHSSIKSYVTNTPTNQDLSLVESPPPTYHPSGPLGPVGYQYPTGTQMPILQTELFKFTLTIDLTGTPHNPPFATHLSYTNLLVPIEGTYAIARWSGNLPKGQIVNGEDKIPVSDTTPFCDQGGFASIGGKVVSYTGIREKFLIGVNTSGAGSVGCCPIDPGTGISPLNNACSAAPPATNTLPPGKDSGPGNPPPDGTTPKDGNPNAGNSNGSLISVFPLGCGAGSILPIPKGSGIQLQVQVDDFAAQADAASREGGDGVHEYLLNAPSQYTTPDQLRRLGVADLTLFGYPIETFEYSTFDQYAIAGNMQRVNLTDPLLNKYFKIQSVQIDEILVDPTGNTPPKRRVTLSSVRFTIQDLLNNLGWGL
jgi:hypothetical protein